MKKECTFGKEEKLRLIRCLTKSLKGLRTMRGWSQEDLAALVGVTRQTILAIENGKRDMTWTMFLAFTLLFIGNEKTKQPLFDSGAYTDELASFIGTGARGI